MTGPGSLSPLRSRSAFDASIVAPGGAPEWHRARFGEQAPKLPAPRARVVTAVHTTLTLLALGYVLWANYVLFTGGNAPLTAWHLSDGDTGTGTFMLFISDWLSLLAFQLFLNRPIEYLLSGLLQPRHPAAGEDTDRDPAAALTPLAELLGPPERLSRGGRIVIPKQAGSPENGP